VALAGSLIALSMLDIVAVDMLEVTSQAADRLCLSTAFF
jgi:hypothetical protein